MNQVQDLIAMPEPRDVDRPAGHYIEKHGPDALDVIPEARACIADTLANFSASEANMRIFLLGRFGQDIDASNDLIEMARSDGFLDALLPVAVSVSGRRDMIAATAAFRRARQSIKRIRDTFAHGVFGHRSDLPEKILVMRADPYREGHRLLFQKIAEQELQPVPPFKFQAWSRNDFLRSADAARALLNAAHAMSVCFGRAPEEVGHWRSALERQGLLAVPPHLVPVNPDRL